MRDPVSFEDLDDLEEALRSASPAEHASAAADLASWAESPHPQDIPFPGDLLIAAGDLLSRAADLSGALAHYQRAAELGTSEGPDANAYVVDTLFQLDRPQEARTLSETLRRARPERVDTYLAMATVWELNGDLRQSLGWSTRGIALAEEVDGPPADLGLLCVARWRVRQEQGMEPDEYDELAMGFLDAVDEGAGEA
ncbi:hypothetical protein FNH13_09915 [Ornithinimicrobium ciconiae]|uniref:Tetratricopeptide repeat protein n=1 Tax=Ornithinimicrobium ciconiae TaxID=2594265 RepID=A0A516GAU0_9MICO|nr:hypothetical protein [Ornithinimicrobium ciconiae]QDO88612.1 hypothetical protein FNH13_09915 [Ornithinimicrobium ciconiae]